MLGDIQRSYGRYKRNTSSSNMGCHQGMWREDVDGREYACTQTSSGCSYLNLFQGNGFALAKTSLIPSGVMMKPVLLNVYKC
jgi:hypothetical protein